MTEPRRDPANRTGEWRGGEFRPTLAKLLAAGRRATARGAAAIVLAAALGAFAALLAAGAAFGSWRFFPLSAFILFWSASAAAAAYAVARRLFPVGGETPFAGELDRRLGGGNLIEAALEFSRGGERVSAYSPALVDMTVRRAAAKLDGLDPRGFFAAAGRPAWAAAGVLLGAVAAIEIALLGGDAGRVVSAIGDPGISFRYPYRPSLVATSGDRMVLPGDSVTVEALNFGAFGGDATLHASTVPGVWRRIPVRREAAGPEELSVSAYRHTFRDIREEIVYAFSAGGARTREHRIGVIHRPVINRVRAVLVYPRYTLARPDTLDPLAGRIAAIAGTRVELAGETSKPVRSARLRFSGGARTALGPKGNGFAGGFAVAADDTFFIDVVDEAGFANDHAVAYPVAAIEDRAPDVEILAPEDGALLPRSLETEIFWRATDDFGVARATLRFMREGRDETFRGIALAPPAGSPPAEIDGRSAWSLEDVNVFPGDRILYYLEVADNNTATGPGTARTPARRLAVPSMSEIYARIHEEDARRRDDLAGVLDEGREIRDRLRKLSENLKAEGDLDWSRRRESGAILEKQRELREKMSQIADEFGKRLDDAEKNRTASREVADKMREIERLMKRIESEDLRRSIEGLQKLMRDMPTRDLMAAMKDLELDAKALLENIDRTIELLKQVLREERMDGLVRRMDDMLKEQTALRDSTARGDTDDLSKKQDRLGDEAERYGKELDRFREEETDGELAAELEKALEEIEKAGLAEEMKRAAAELSRGERENAQCTQQGAIDDMLSLFTRLTQCRLSMGLAIEREVAEAIGRSTRELVEASKLQENVAARLGGSGRSGSADLIQEALVAKTAVERIATSLHELGRKTMAVSPAAFIHLGGALRDMDEALRRMEEERGREAAAAAASAYRGMNLAAIELLRAGSSAGAGGGGARQRMQQLLQRQLSLRQELQRLLERGEAGEWSMEERAGMARLAAEQRRMEELARQIAEESRGTGELMGSLDDIAGRMEEIAKELEAGRLDDDLVERQERIITRLLDSQRSMRERDFKQERRSTPAGDAAPLAPEARRAPESEREALLRMIRRGMQEKGPAEYEDLIRQYFRALSERAREEP